MNQVAKIIHYNQNDGKGTISANGQNYSFEISHWRGDHAPRLNGTVQIELNESGALLAVHPKVSSSGDTHAQLAELGGQLSKAFSQHGGNIGQQLLALQGIPVLTAYVLFLISGLFLTLINVQLGMGVSYSVTLYRFSEIAGRIGQGNGLTLLVFWLSTASVLAPVFIRHRLVPLLLCLPLFTCLLALYDFYSLYAVAKAATEQVTNLYGNLLGSRARTSIADSVSFGKVLGQAGLGFYLMLATSAVLAFFGVTRFKQIQNS